MQPTPESRPTLPLRLVAILTTLFALAAFLWLTLPAWGASGTVVSPQTVSGAQTFTGTNSHSGPETFTGSVGLRALTIISGPLAMTNAVVIQPQLVNVPVTVTNWMFTNPIVVLGLTNTTAIAGIRPYASNQLLTLVNPGYGAYSLTISNLDATYETNPLYRINTCVASNLVFTNGSITLWYGLSNRWRIISRAHDNF